MPGTTDRHPVPRATVPVGKRRHVPRPPPAHGPRHCHRAAAPRSHRRRRRDRPVARALRRIPAHHGRPNRPSDDAAGQGPRGATARTPPRHGRAGDPLALPLRDPPRAAPASAGTTPGSSRSRSATCERLGTTSVTGSCTRSHTRSLVPATDTTSVVTAARRIGRTAKRYSTVNPQRPRARLLTSSNARADMPTLLGRSDDRSDGTCAVKRPPADLLRPRRPAALSAHPPALLTTRPGGASNSCARHAYSTTIAKGRALRTSCCRGATRPKQPARPRAGPRYRW